MLVVPLQAVASQQVNVTLANQNTTINVYQLSTGLFVDVLVNGVLIIGGVIAENLNVIVRSVYLGFTGDIAFVDTQGSADPVYTGLGTRWILGYFSPSELPAGVS